MEGFALLKQVKTEGKAKEIIHFKTKKYVLQRTNDDIILALFVCFS
jgi:hypothetical protein